MTDDKAREALKKILDGLRWFETLPDHYRENGARCIIAAIKEKKVPGVGVCEGCRVKETKKRNTYLEMEPKCNCSAFHRGQLTGGWICPVHGQQF